MKYYEISEKELVELIADQIHLGCMQAAGVDNWEDGDMTAEIFNNDCIEAGLDPDCDLTYRDLAKHYLKNYREIC